MFRFARFIALTLLWFIALSLIWVAIYTIVPPPTTITMLMDGEGATRDWMSLDDMDADMARAAIAGEDGKFCQHNGFDGAAIAQAIQRNVTGARMRGGSTISQQTAKNAFLWQGSGTFSRLARKLPEAWFTLLIETMWGKRRIMEVYLNIAETGIGTYGANAGSQRYFRHDASQLSRAEAARIAAVLPLPKRRGAIDPRGQTRRYGNRIASRMAVVQRDGLDACLR
ncbi:MAG: monofunctional biosynthetic peptidoglycan transglycosylase [Sphingopyxis sp.]